MTDFDVHAFWVQPGADLTCVATEELRAILADRGVPPDRVAATGIPILPEFSTAHDRRAIRASLGIRDEKPAVLVMGGGSGVGSMLDAVTAARDAGNVHVLAVAGRNEALERRLRALAPPAGGTLPAFGFVSNVHELMAASDVAVTKSGGLTTAECLASGLPMVVRDPIPGQEERNCDFVLEAGAGVRTHGPASLRFKLGALLADPARLSRMKAAARAAGRPRAARRSSPASSERAPRRRLRGVRTGVKDLAERPLPLVFPFPGRSVTVDQVALEERAAALGKRSIKKATKVAGLKLAISMMDLTTLEGKDSPGKVRQMCAKAVRPDPERPRPCRPSRPSASTRTSSRIAKRALAGSTVKVASVATAFPSGPLAARR